MSQSLNAIHGRAVGRNGLLRDLNHRAVYEQLANEGPASRADLARRLELSAASVGRVVEGLIRAGLVEEGERVAGGVGRPQTLLHVNARAGLVAGMSIRSKSMRLHLSDLAGTIVARAQVERTDAGIDALAGQMRDLVLQTRAAHAPELKLASLVVGISGVWDESDRQVYAAPNLSILEGVDARTLFHAALSEHIRPESVQVDNDINLAALGEWEHGAATGVDNFFYLSLGSGIGGAAVISGSLYRGLRGFAGELGYLPVHVGGRLRSLEQVIGRRALEEFAAHAGLPVPGGEVFGYLANQASDHDDIADYVTEALGQALVAVVVTLNPRLIVLGGGVGRYGSVWIERIRERLNGFVPIVPSIVSTELGREASLMGAVGLGRNIARSTLLALELAA
ncbi:MAG: ROK family transcriptional regulator [Trueperaceae bacterium]